MMRMNLDPARPERRAQHTNGRLFVLDCLRTNFITGTRAEIGSGPGLPQKSILSKHL